jgi:ribosomal protein L37AE/L43A
VAEPDNQRVYRAPCPGCGAPVEFRGAQSAFAVCSYCQSTVVRQGDVLSRVGKMAELFDDHSPLQLQASGVWEGRSFTLVGRLQFKSASGTWTEWNAVFDDASNATLGEDNGSYVFSRAAPMARAVPEAARFRVGATTAVGGKSFSVAASDQVALLSAQGEVPRLPALGQPFAVVELRSADGEVLSIEYDGEPPSVSRGRAVLLETLQLTGLREELVKEERGREFACPHCGAPIEVTLANSKSITCRSCHSLIDLASGTGAELKHALQGEFIKPLIALGTVGQLQGTHWQVVGFQHRTGHDPQEEDAEHFGWDEYLLFNAKRGFTFLVDSEEGWSVVKPVTGAPAWTPGARTASYLSTTYALAYSYEAETTYVAGEFLLAGRARPKNLQPGLRQGRQPAVDGTDADRGDLVQRQQTEQRPSGGGVQDGGPQRPAQAHRRQPVEQCKRHGLRDGDLCPGRDCLVSCADAQLHQLRSGTRRLLAQFWSQQRRLIRWVFIGRGTQMNFSGEHHGT